MSFYFDDDDEYDLYYDDNTSSQQQQSQQQLQQRIKSQANGSQNDGFVCHNCGGTESYEDDSGALICTECYTLSQTAVASSQMQFDFDEAQGLGTRTSRGHFKQIKTAKAGGSTAQRGKKLEEYDNSVRLPSVIECIQGMQRILEESSTKISDLVFLQHQADGGKNQPSKFFVLDSVKAMWKAYLLAWHQGANALGQLYPEVRFCFRDLFLSPLLRTRLAKTLSYQAAKELREKIKQDVKKEERNSETKTTSNPDENNDDDQSDNDFESERSDSTNTTKIPVTFAPRYRAMNPLAQLVHRHCKATSKSRTIRIRRKEAALILEPSMLMVASMLLLATSSLGITAGHIRKWIANCSLPLLDSFSLLRPDEQQALKPIQDFFRLHSLPSVATLERMATNLQVACGYKPRKIKLLHMHNGRKTKTESSRSFKPGRLLVPASVPVATARFVGELGLSQKVLTYALAIIGIKTLDLNISTMDELNLDLTTMWIPPHLKRARPDLILDRHKILAVIVVACKMIPGWQNITLQGPFLQRDILNQKDFGKEVGENATKRRKLVQSHTRLVPSRPADCRFVKNGESVTRYLDFLEETVIDPADTTMPDFVANLEEQRRKQTLSDIRNTDTAEVIPCNTIFVYKDKQLEPPLKAKRVTKATSSKKETKRGWHGPRQSHVYELTMKRTGAGNNIPAPLGPLIEYIAYNTMSDPVEIVDFVAELDEEIAEKKKNGKLK